MSEQLEKNRHVPVAYDDYSQLLPRKGEPPRNWKMVNQVSDGRSYLRPDGLLVLISCAIEDDGKRWLHVSLSRRGCAPDYQDICIVKQLFIGDEHEAIQIFPPKERYVNLYEVLHLWHCFDGSLLPQFEGLVRLGKEKVRSI